MSMDSKSHTSLWTKPHKVLGHTMSMSMDIMDISTDIKSHTRYDLYVTDRLMDAVL